MEYIKNELQIIKSDAVKRRLEREFKQLVSNELVYPESVTVKIGEEKTPGISNYIVGFYSSYENKYFEFFLNINYPFKSPKLNLNCKPYSYLHYLNSKSADFNKKLLKYKKIRCLCCSSILCNDNWSPGYTMRHVIDEVKMFKNMCTDISKIVMIDVIKRKYLIDDIDIIGWIF